jgi:hypothetical protein
MQPRTIINVLDRWHRVPIATRLAILSATIIESNPGGVEAIVALVATAGIMGQHLSPAQKFEVVHALRMTVAELLNDEPRLLN